MVKPYTKGADRCIFMHIHLKCRLIYTTTIANYWYIYSNLQLGEYIYTNLSIYTKL